MDDTEKNERTERLTLRSVCLSPRHYGCDHLGHILKNDSYLLSLTNTIGLFPLSDFPRSGGCFVLSPMTTIRSSDHEWRGLPQTRIPNSIALHIIDAVGRILVWISFLRSRWYCDSSSRAPPLFLTSFLHTRDKRIEKIVK